jgi:hypothetical protein
MKRMIWCACLLFSMTLITEAQTKGKTGVKKHQASTNKSTVKKTQPKTNLNIKNNPSLDTSTVLTSTGAYPAYRSTEAEAGRLQIADPTIRTYNQRAFVNTQLDIPGSGIIGMPKLVYGINHGHIIFRSTDSPTIGTSTGSGSVGTGTNVGPIGTAGHAIGVNGKNPYAGTDIYGLPIRDANISRLSVEGARPIGVRIKY